jgi:hypothetical protein
MVKELREERKAMVERQWSRGKQSQLEAPINFSELAFPTSLQLLPSHTAA